MNEDMLVSVVIPIFNVEKYIRECVNSLLRQTYKNMEIILVDDGSPDNCPNICDSYLALDKRIKVIHKNNGGLSDARNKGIDIATGQYLVFVDGDDFLLPDAIGRMVKIAAEYHADIVCIRYIRCEEDESFMNMKISRKTTEKILKYEGIDKIREFLSGDTINTTAWGKMYCTKFFKKIRFPYGKYHEDVYTTYKLVDIAERIVSSSYIGYVYRKNRKSITGEQFSEKRLDAIEGKIFQAEFIKRKYPMLIDEAYVDIIYACNTCLKLMAISGYKNLDIYKKLHDLYKKYGRYYLKGNVSSKGKIVTIIAILNIRFAVIILKIGSR